MNWAAARRGVSWLVPEAVLLGAAVLVLRQDALRDPLREFARFYPYVVYGLGLVLALRFQRSRLVFALLLLACVQWSIGHWTRGQVAYLTFQSAAALLPLNLAAIALMAERGTFTRTGLLRLAVLAVQAAAIAAAVRFAPERAAAVVGYHVLPAGWFLWTPLAQVPLLAFVAGAALITLGVVFQASPTGRPFLWALIAAFLALHAGGRGLAAVLYLGTAGLILVVAVIEASYLMAYQDGLTGLPARRALNEALLRIGGQYTVAMVDVDHFKKLNDRFGHDVGDQVLRMVAGRLARVGGGGRSFRYGGEEFAVVFAGKGVEECLPELENLRRAIEDAKFRVRRRLRPRKKPQARTGGGATGSGRHVAVTVSIGAAEPNGRQKTPDQVVEAADRALYRAKDAGRNRVKT